MNELIIAFVTGITTGGLSCLAVQGGLLASSMASQIESDIAGENLNQPRNMVLAGEINCLHSSGIVTGMDRIHDPAFPTPQSYSTDRNWHLHAGKRITTIECSSNFSLLQYRAAGFHPQIYPTEIQKGRIIPDSNLPWCSNCPHSLRDYPGNDGCCDRNWGSAERGSITVRFHPWYQPYLFRGRLLCHPSGFSDGKILHEIRSSSGPGHWTLHHQYRIKFAGFSAFIEQSIQLCVSSASRTGISG